MDCAKIADEIARRLKPLIADLADGFHCSFRYTQTGNNLAHPITWGYLSRLLWDMPRIMRVGIDLRLNLGRNIKFQPDLAAWSSPEKLAVLLDYESPNSSDARIPTKDIDPYLAWRRESRTSVPYIIVTTLPNRPAPDWELRYTSPGHCNEHFRGRRDEIRKNPFEFWYRYYMDEIANRDVTDIALVNIDGKSVYRSYPV